MTSAANAIKWMGQGALIAFALYTLMHWFGEHRMGFSFYIHDKKPPVTIYHEWSPDFRPSRVAPEPTQEHSI